MDCVDDEMSWRPGVRITYIIAVGKYRGWGIREETYINPVYYNNGAIKISGGKQKQYEEDNDRGMSPGPGGRVYDEGH